MWDIDENEKLEISPLRKTGVTRTDGEKEERGSHDHMAFCFPLHFHYRVCHSRKKKKKTICTAPPPPLRISYLHINPVSLVWALFSFLLCHTGCSPLCWFVRLLPSDTRPELTGRAHYPRPRLLLRLLWRLLVPVWPLLPTVDDKRSLYTPLLSLHVSQSVLCPPLPPIISSYLVCVCVCVCTCLVTSFAPFTA